MHHCGSDGFANFGLSVRSRVTAADPDFGVCAVRTARWVVCMDPPCIGGRYLRLIMLCDGMVGGVSKSVTGIIRLLYWIAFVGCRPSVWLAAAVRRLSVWRWRWV